MMKHDMFTARLAKPAAFVLMAAMLVLSLPAANAEACTSFSVKSETGNVWHGRNWDFGYADNVVFKLADLGGGLCSFQCVMGWDGFLCSAVNSEGFYVACNEEPYAGSDISDNTKVLISDLREAAVRFTSVGDVEKFLGGREVYCSYYPEHVFFADKDGGALLVETDNENTYFIRSQNSFLVATNFPLYALDSPDDINDARTWCNRYAAAYDRLSESAASFDLQSGIETLRGSLGATYYSFLHDAANNEIYIFLDRDFDKIWKFSFGTKKLSTYQGFDDPLEVDMDSRGVYYADLLAYQRDGTTFSTITSRDNSRDEAVLIDWDQPFGDRASLISVIYGIEEGELKEKHGSPFSDVTAGAWYCDAIAWAASEGIVAGYGDGRFGPDDIVTREQLAAVFYRYAQKKGLDTSKTADLNVYSDAGQISLWALDAVNWANAEGMMQGRTAEKFEPQAAASLGEAANMLTLYELKIFEMD